MKKRVFVFALLLALSLVCCAFADDGLTFYVPEKEVSVFVPFDIMCITRESDETNTFFQNEYFDYATVHQYMISNNYYLYGMTPDYQGEFMLMITDYDGIDFNTASDRLVEDYGTMMEDLFASQGATDVTSDIYRGKNNKAIHLTYTLVTALGNQYVNFYFTTHGSSMYSFRFISFFTPASASQKEMLRNIFDSAEWGRTDYTPGTKGETNGNNYTDYETGLTFPVPSGWNEVKFVAGAEEKKAKYRIGTEEVWVLYESGDLWEIIKESYGSLISAYGITREDCDNRLLSEEIIYDMFECGDGDTITMKTIGSQEYYYVDKTAEYTVSGVSITNHDIICICMRNGYLYWFQLSGVDTSKYENQFIQFLKTVEYP